MTLLFKTTVGALLAFGQHVEFKINGYLSKKAVVNFHAMAGMKGNYFLEPPNAQKGKRSLECFLH